MLDSLLDFFRIEPIKFHRTAMERLVQEAMLVNKKQGRILNLKEEYVRNTLPVMRVEGRVVRNVVESKRSVMDKDNGEDDVRLIMNTCSMKAKRRGE